MTTKAIILINTWLQIRYCIEEMVKQPKINPSLGEGYAMLIFASSKVKKLALDLTPLIITYIKKSIYSSTITASVAPQIWILRSPLGITGINNLEENQLPDTSLQEEELPEISVLIRNNHIPGMLMSEETETEKGPYLLKSKSGWILFA